MRDFKNKVVVITGAASGMGRAYAEVFAGLGARLALCDFDTEGLTETGRLVMAKADSEPLLETFDIAEEGQVFAFADQVIERFGQVDVLINNAGIEGSSKPVWATGSDYFSRVMAVNYFGVVNCTRAFLTTMRKQNHGVIVNVSSIFGLVGTPNHSDYCGSKFAVRGFTEALMVELRETPIQVHLLHPGGVATNIARQAHSQSFSKHFLTTPPEEVAHIVIRAIAKNQPRIVCGNNAWKAAWGARLLSLRALSAVLWNEMKSVIDLSDYSRSKPKT